MPIWRLFLFIVLVFSPFASYAQDEDEPVTIFLGWTNQFQFAGYYAAVEKGFYKEAGYDVQLIPSLDPQGIEMVIAGEYDFGSAPGALLLSHLNFDQISILASIFQQSPISLLTLRENKIHTLKDLEGKRIAGGSELRAMLMSASVDLKKVTIDGVSTDFENLINGSYDAVSYYITDHARMLGSDSILFRTFRPIEYGIGFYGDCLFTSRELVENDPLRIEGILDATLKGWEYAISNPEEIVKIIIDKYETEWNEEQLLDEAEITIHSLILPRFYDIGDMQLSKWQASADVLFELGIMDRQIDLSGFIYTPASIDNNLKKTLVIMGVIIAFAGLVLLGLFFYNRQLQRAVLLRTVSLKKANMEMDKFVYSVSHDIRSPLFSIQGIINLMRSDPQGSTQYIDLIETSIQRLNDFTSDILDYSRNSRADIIYSFVEVDNVVEKILSDFKYLAPEDEIDISTEFDLKTPFQTDVWRLEVILSNLISNSIKYRDNTKQNCFITIKAKTSKRGLTFTIDDNGIGIGAEHISKIYQMFYRATEGSQGSGLGLYLVQETIQILNGSIQLDSKIDEGTRIQVLIPNV